MLSEFGKEIRKIRIEKGDLLKNMADKLKVTSSYLSAIEHGKKPIPSDFVNKIEKLYSLSDNQVNVLKNMAEKSKESIEISLKGKDDNMIALANAFARKFDNMSAERAEKITEILHEEDD